MIIVSLSLFIAGSVMCALAPNLPVLILGRGLQGAVSGGGILPIVADHHLRHHHPARKRPVPGLFLRRVGRAGIGGPVLGGLFAEHLHWSMIFWINLPLAALALTLLLPKMAKIPAFHRRRKVDWLGGVLLMGPPPYCSCWS